VSSNSLFRRDWKIQVGTLDVSALDFEFEVLRTIKPEPNKATLTLYNLNKDHRAQLLKRQNFSAVDFLTLQTQLVANAIKGVPVRIDAGYIDNVSAIFAGDLSEVGGARDVSDRKITISGQDGGRAAREGVISATFAKGTPLATVFQQCASAMGVGLGNVSNFTASASIPGIGTVLPAQMVLSGSAFDAMVRITKSMGLTFSIQAGALQVLAKGQPLNSAAIRISPETGLVGSPEASIDSTVSLGNPQQFAAGAKQKVAKPPKPKDPGILKLTTLMIPGLTPGRKIALESDQYSGGYVATECRYRGQSWSNTWNIETVARIY
jgi:hypothetical protein